MNALPQVL
jgi:hypothetical protein